MHSYPKSIIVCSELSAPVPQAKGNKGRVPEPAGSARCYWEAWEASQMTHGGLGICEHLNWEPISNVAGAWLVDSGGW